MLLVNAIFGRVVVLCKPGAMVAGCEGTAGCCTGLGLRDRTRQTCRNITSKLLTWRPARAEWLCCFLGPSAEALPPEVLPPDFPFPPGIVVYLVTEDVALENGSVKVVEKDAKYENRNAQLSKLSVLVVDCCCRMEEEAADAVVSKDFFRVGVTRRSRE